MGFRLYDSSTGRFLSRDPLHGTVGAPLTVNPYIYALNSPLHYLDPLGLRPATQQSLDKPTRKLTDAIVAWAWTTNPQYPFEFDPVEFALRLTFFQTATQQRVRELQARITHMDQAQASGLGHATGLSSGGPSHTLRQKLTDSIEVLQRVVKQLGDILSGRRQW